MIKVNDLTVNTPELIADQIRQRGCEPSVGPVAAGWDIQQNPDEFGQFAAFCIEQGVETVLELGTGRTGGLARFMAEVLGWRVTSVDINRPLPESPLVEFIQGTTLAVYPYLAGRTFDLVFIDADHAYPAVKADWSAYQHVGRIIAFHDVAPGRKCCPGTIRFWQEFAYENGRLKSGYYEAIWPGQSAGIGWYVNPSPQPRDFREEWGKPLPAVASEADITVVTGTFNRLPHLMAMIESARLSIPRGIKLDFVVVDGGSTDGTIEWAKAQPDVFLIEHGELKGAIRAFCDGAQAATGRYIVMANDDITFEGMALFEALLHLEATPRCGAVAFQFDEPGSEGEYKVNHQGLIASGEKHTTPYAQVGMYPKWLGDAVGWWGADDPQFPARTYGGDNYLSSRILESGYLIDVIDGAIYHDHLVPDALRQINNHAHLDGGQHPDTRAWWDRFNGGLPEYKSKPLESRREEVLKILYLPIYDGDSDIKQRERIGWLRSLQKIGMVIEVDYRNLGTRRGRGALHRVLLDLVQQFQPDLCITQVHTPDFLTSYTLRQMRAARPQMLVVNWNGDEYVPVDLDAGLEYMKLVDLQLVVNGAAFTPLIEHGIRVAYQFDSYQPVEPVPMPEHDVVFLGNCYRDERRALEAKLRALPGVNVGLYGRGWNHADGDTLYHYSASYGVYAGAKLAVVDNMYDDRFAYVSDRTFMALAHSQCVLWKVCPGAESIFGFIEGAHYIGWTDLDDLADKIALMLKPQNDPIRKSIGSAARDFVRRYHTYDARTRGLLDTLERMFK